MNEYIIDGFMDELEKRANLGSLLAHMAAGAVAGAPIAAAIESVDEEPDYRRK